MLFKLSSPSNLITLVEAVPGPRLSQIGSRMLWANTLPRKKGLRIRTSELFTHS